jgi:hypothetical protein
MERDLPQFGTEVDVVVVVDDGVGLVEVSAA